MSPSESTPNATEQPSWMNNKAPGNLRSLLNRISAKANRLYDGTAVGFMGDPVPYVEGDPREETITFKTSTPSKGKIAAINYGASMVSKFLPLFIQGNSLAIMKGRGYDTVNFFEAAHDGLIQEINFRDMLKYLGFNEEVEFMESSCGTFSNAILQVAGPEYPQSTYRVTNKGEKSGLLLVDEKKNTGGGPPFIGGGGLFGSRRRITSH